MLTESVAARQRHTKLRMIIMIIFVELLQYTMTMCFVSKQFIHVATPLYNERFMIQGWDDAIIFCFAGCGRSGQ